MYKQETKAVPPQQAALNELRKVSTGPEDDAYLDSEQQQIDEARAAVLGSGAVDHTLVETPHGVTSQEEIDRIKTAGQELPLGAYDAGHRE
ncbi:MAG TPA: hypothetical protein VFL85_02600 [Candidatus Saccharimonadales bacterium]|nr:hypothetical protein [Candidatus Saccharimonadales bacterium]